MPATYTREMLRINDLQLDLENPRFPEQPDQPTAITTMLNREWLSVLELAQHITTLRVMNPLDSPLVVPDGKQYIVIEGNRRVTALKVLHNPSLIETADISGGQKKKLEDIASTFAKHPIDYVECVIYPSKDLPEVKEWRALKHSGSGGAAPKEWDGMSKERDRANRGKPSAQYSLISKIASSNDTSQAIKEAFEADRFPPSTIKKAIDSPEIRKVLGMEKNGEKILCIIPEKEFIRRVTSFLEDFIQPEGRGRAIKTEDDISVATKQREYANQLSERLTPIKEEEKSLPSEFKPEEKPIDEATSGKKTEEESKPRPNSAAKDKKLIPQDFQPRNLPPKARRLIEELRDKLPVKKSPITVAFGIRSLIEYTLYETARALEVSLEPDGLKDLGLRICAHMQSANDAVRAHNNTPGLKKPDRKKDPFLKGVVIHLQDLCNSGPDANPHSIHKLHQYVHNPFMIPDDEGLFKLWDAYQLTLSYLWEIVDKAGFTKDDEPTKS